MGISAAKFKRNIANCYKNVAFILKYIFFQSTCIFLRLNHGLNKLQWETRERVIFSAGVNQKFFNE